MHDSARTQTCAGSRDGAPEQQHALQMKREGHSGSNGSFYDKDGSRCILLGKEMSEMSEQGEHSEVQYRRPYEHMAEVRLHAERQHGLHAEKVRKTGHQWNEGHPAQHFNGRGVNCGP